MKKDSNLYIDYMLMFLFILSRISLNMTDQVPLDGGALAIIAACVQIYACSAIERQSWKCGVWGLISTHNQSVAVMDVEHISLRLIIDSLSSDIASTTDVFHVLGATSGCDRDDADIRLCRRLLCLIYRRKM